MTDVMMIKRMRTYHRFVPQHNKKLVKHPVWSVVSETRAETALTMAYSESFRKFQKVSEISESFRKFQKVSESFRKFQKISESFRKFQKVSESFRKS